MSNYIDADISDVSGIQKFAVFLIESSVLISLLNQTFPDHISPSINILLTLYSIGAGLLGYIIYRNVFKCSSICLKVELLFLYLLIVGIVQGISFSSFDIFNMDFRYSMFILTACALSSNEYGMYSFHRLMRVLGVISIIFGIVGILEFSQEGYSIAARTGTWTQSYFYWWASSATFIYWGFYALFCKRERLIGYSVVIVYFILGMLFLKRIAFVNVVVMFLFYFYKSGQVGIKNIVVGIGAIVVFLLLLQHYFGETYGMVSELLLQRFDNAQNISEVDRVEEFRAYTDHASILDIIFGNGIGHHAYSIIMEGGEALNVHVGWLNFIFKGGLFYFCFMVVLFCHILFMARRQKIMDPELLACIGVAFSFSISLFVEGGWTTTIAPFCIYTPIFYAYSKV